MSPFDPRSVTRRRTTAPTTCPELRCWAFSFASRGDRVPGRLLLPETGAGPFPTVLLAHGAGGSKDASYMDASAGPWARRGLAVASIDFPLHGERSEAKLFALVASELARPDPSGTGLLADFAAQAISDLENCLSALCEWPEIDPNRLGYAGFSLGSIIGATFCAGEPRVRAAALALGGAGLVSGPLDPAGPVARFAPRPLLFVNANDDETIPREAARALFDAAAEPKQQLWFEGTHDALPGAALKAMWQFLQQNLA